MSLQFAANLSMLFKEVPFIERFDKAAEYGFKAVEFLFPYEENRDAIKEKLDELGLTLALFNLHPGKMNKAQIIKGEWGTVSNPSRRDYFKWSCETALEWATFFGCQRLNIMIGKRVPEISPSEQMECALQNINWAMPYAADAGVTLHVEPLNNFDFPGYWIATTHQAMQIVKQVDHPNLKLQFDIYHAQISEGNLVRMVHDVFDSIGHIQFADVPGRNQPGTGEIDFLSVFKELQLLGYEGYIGAEYAPLGETGVTLSWVREYR